MKMNDLKEQNHNHDNCEVITVECGIIENYLHFRIPIGLFKFKKELVVKKMIECFEGLYDETVEKIKQEASND